MAKMGRPLIDIDKKLFEKSCGLQCTLPEIAFMCNCSEDTIERWCKREYEKGFAEVYKTYSSGGKTSLRRSQFELAKKSAAMAIWLGKQILGQKDTVEYNNTVTPQTNKTYVAASLDLWEYCKLKAPGFYYDEVKYLKEICRALQNFEDDDNELLIINLPPRHGKSRTAGLAAQWYLGRDPKLKLIMASYNEKLSRQFSKSVRNDIQEIKAEENRPVFSDVFPGVTIQQGSATADLWRLEGSPTNNYLSTSPKSSLTGFGGDIIFIDDVVKNNYEASHKQLLEEQFQWFTDTLYSRLEGKAKLVIIMTRWSTKDLAGRIIELYSEQKRKIRIITKKAFDSETGKMLNDRILDKERYDNLIQTVGEDIVRANYDQEPIDLKGMLYGEFITYNEKPRFRAIHSICDTADEGKDYLCNIIYGITDEIEPKAYVIDVLYTQDSMEKTERELVKRLDEYQVDRAVFESNFGGKAFVKIIEKQSREAGNYKTLFEAFAQTQNKEARILAHASAVTRSVYMPFGWDKLFPIFYRDLTEYQRQGNNINDDGPDAITGIVERLNKNKKVLGSR